MIKINLYDYQRIAQEVTIQKMVMTALLIVFVALGLTGLSYVNDTIRVSNAQAEVVEAQQKVNQIKPQYDVVQKLRTREEGLKKKIQGLEGLRSAKVPFARLLEDVGRVAPEGVWLKKVEQENEMKLRGMRVPILFLDKAPKGKRRGRCPTPTSTSLSNSRAWPGLTGEWSGSWKPWNPWTTWTM